MNCALRIVYMGTPDFAVEPLKKLLDSGYNVVGVVTMPDKAIGRHHDTLQPSPVKKFYMEQHLDEKGVRLLQPEKLKDEAFLEELRSLQADLQIVVAFRMLPEVVWGMPPMGTFNLHTALLPQYRGAAPMNWAIINGDKETGVTTFFLDHDIDTGRIIMQDRTPIHETDNVEDIHDRLMMMGSDLVLKTVRAIEEGTATSVPQEQFITDEPLRHAPKIFKETCQIDWKAGMAYVYNFVRGLSPYPAAWSTLVTPDGKRQDVKIYKTHKETTGQQTNEVGSVITDGKTLKVAVEDGFIVIDELQVAGKKRMAVADYLRGARIPDGSCFE
ncbi:MAG: methionyl-tRNA formyltransferase [Bacteroidaceae bacterium]|nr:methionyl-tRNA formyltransferase [Bacteroidaceae bacterium]